MGHRIAAIILSGPYDEAKAKSFDLHAIPLTSQLTLFPLHPRHNSHWAEQLQLDGEAYHYPLLNTEVTLHLVNTIAEQPRFAVIATEYIGGNGGQYAIVYEGLTELFQDETTGVKSVPKSIGPINAALWHLGVTPSRGKDEFDTVDLGRFRDFDDLFSKYDDPDLS